MDKPKTTPKDFFLWAGAMVTLYAGVVAFITLLFQYIDAAFPDPAFTYYIDPYQSGVAYSMASLIVLAPVFLILMRIIRRDIARDPSRGDIWVRRWALFLVLFVAGATLVIDLIVLINTFLSGGELTARFLLKVLVVFLVAGAGFLHFISDLRGYWSANRSYARAVNWGVAVLVVVSIVAGFFIIGTPQEMRKLRIDNQRVGDLQNIQWQIVNYWQQKESLPATLDELRDPIAGANIPVDPVTGAPYTYARTSPLDFKLCATFDTEGRKIAGSDGPIAKPMSVGGLDENWQHGQGEVCFDRSIDPSRYPPYR